MSDVGMRSQSRFLCMVQQQHGEKAQNECCACASCWQAAVHIVLCVMECLKTLRDDYCQGSAYNQPCPCRCYHLQSGIGAFRAWLVGHLDVLVKFTVKTVAEHSEILQAV